MLTQIKKLTPVLLIKNKGLGQFQDFLNKGFSFHKNNRFSFQACILLKTCSKFSFLYLKQNSVRIVWQHLLFKSFLKLPSSLLLLSLLQFNFVVIVWRNAVIASKNFSHLVVLAVNCLIIFLTVHNCTYFKTDNGLQMAMYPLE